MNGPRRMMTNDGNKFIDKGDNVEIIGPEGAWIVIQRADLAEVAEFLAADKLEELHAKLDREREYSNQLLRQLSNTRRLVDCSYCHKTHSVLNGAKECAPGAWRDAE